MADTVKVTLRRSLGVRQVGGPARHYGPGTVNMPIADAQSLGIVDEDGKVRKQYKAQQKAQEEQRSKAGRKALQRERALTPWGENKSTDEGDESDGYDSWTVDELRAEAERRQIKVTRGDGQDGEPLKADFVKALEKSDG